MCKRLKKENANVLKRIIVWIAWHILKPKCKDCEEAQACVYNAVMTRKETED